MLIHTLKIEQVFENLNTTENGLSDKEAERRLKEYGENIIKEVAKENRFLKFLKHFFHTLAILLWIASILCFYSEYKHPGEGILNLGIAIIVVIIVNGFFSFIQERKAEKALEELKKLLPFKAKVVRNGKIREIPASYVVPGDLIILESGDKVPADGRIVESDNFFVNMAPLTGESEPKNRNEKPYYGEYLDSPNLVFAGTLVVNGYCKIVAYATGMATEFGKIAHITTGIKDTPGTLKKEISSVTKFVGIFATLTGIIFFLTGFLIGRTFWENFLFAIGIIIANVPEGLLPTVTISLAMSAQRMAKKNALVKSLNAIETLGSITVICTDKTGTLTQNKMEVKEIFTFEKNNRQKILEIALFCNNAYIDAEGNIQGDPTETALFSYANKEINKRGIKIKELPFDSDRKRMSVLYRFDGKLFVYTKGALETLLPLCKYVLKEDTHEIIKEDSIKEINKAYEELTKKGLRVLAFAYKPVKEIGEIIEDDLIFVGLVGLYDPPHPEVPEAIRKCKKAGIRIIMITGDAGNTANALAKEIGIETTKLFSNMDIAKQNDRTLKEILKEGDIIFYRMNPLDKLRIVNLLKELDEIVAVTGDGVNDAPALKKADCGISMGIMGTDVAKEVSDMILLDDNFASIVSAIEEGRNIFLNIKNFITYIFSSNIPEIVPYILYVLTGIPLPLTIMQILAIDLGTDMLPALALGAEKPDVNIMNKPPRKKNEKLLDIKTLLRAYLFLGPIEAIAGLFGYFYVISQGFTNFNIFSVAKEVYFSATSACFLGIVITQIGNVFVCRSYDTSVFSMGFTTNRLILIGIMTEILLTLFIIYTPIGNILFQTKPLSFEVWLYLIPFCLILVMADEMRKLLIRKKKLSLP
ncbi:MAG: cation-transporting P-type ATPase [Proteobacteria bacterium]|nr:cation-transporting P-type ATPase [Pseudomonadota bacterium]